MVETKPRWKPLCRRAPEICVARVHVHKYTRICTYIQIYKYMYIHTNISIHPCTYI